MAKQVKTNLDRLDDAIARVLKDYGDDVSGYLEEIIVKSARRGASALRRESAATFGGQKYAKQWTTTVERKRLYMTAIIHNKWPSLPHLLENGHLMRNGQRWTPPRKHIEPVEAELVQQVEREVLSKL